MNREDLKNERYNLERKYNFYKGLRAGLFITEYALPLIMASVVTLTGAKKIFNTSPKLENEKATYEYALEEIDSNGSVYVTYELGEHATSSKRIYDETAVVKVDYYEPWIKKDDHYYRTITQYEFTSDRDMIDTIKNSINNLTEEDLQKLKFRKVNEFTQEGYNLTEEQINEKAFVKVNNRYISSIVYTPETIDNNAKETFIVVIIMGCVLFFTYLSNAVLVNQLIEKGYHVTPKRIDDKIDEYDNKINEINKVLKKVN